MPPNARKTDSEDEEEKKLDPALAVPRRCVLACVRTFVDKDEADK